MRLAQLHGEEVARLPLRDYLPKPPKDRWQGVTFEHLLDMATGHYWDPADQEDEKDTTTELNFFVIENQNRKLRGAMAFTTREPPGQRWVYHTTDTYLLTYAMAEYVGRLTGATKKEPADLLGFVVDEIYRPSACRPAHSRRCAPTTGPTAGPSAATACSGPRTTFSRSPTC